MVKRKGLPEWGELVLCTVQRITPYAAWCKLDEYSGNAEGMIHVSEVSGKWVHDIRDFVKPNKQYVAKVVRVDKEKNSVNLSLKRVSFRDAKEKLNFFRREQRAEKILEQAAKELNKTLEQAYEEVGFLLQEKFGELFVAFEEARKSQDELVKAGVPEKWIKALMKIIEKSFREKEIIIKAELELRSYATDGIEKIKDTLIKLQNVTEATIKYISAPKYLIQIKTKDPKNTEKKLRESIESVIKQFEGEASYKMVK